MSRLREFYAKPGVNMGKCEILRISDSGKAFLALLPDRDQVWVPFSQLHGTSEIVSYSEPGDRGALVVSEWIADQNGWRVEGP